MNKKLLIIVAIIILVVLGLFVYGNSSLLGGNLFNKSSQYQNKLAPQAQNSDMQMLKDQRNSAPQDMQMLKNSNGMQM